MGSRLRKSEVTEILMKQFDTEMVIPLNSNFFHVHHNNLPKPIYVSQCKPSTYSKGNWDYLFFHTITETVLERILFGNGNLVLINYVHGSVIILNAADIAWAIRHSSRVKNTQGKEEYVTDFVVEKLESGSVCLTPYNRSLSLEREIRLIVP